MSRHQEQDKLDEQRKEEQQPQWQLLPSETSLGEFLLFGCYLYVRQENNNTTFKALLSLIQSLNYLNPLSQDCGNYHVYNCVLDQQGKLKVYKSECIMRSGDERGCKACRLSLLAESRMIDQNYHDLDRSQNWGRNQDQMNEGKRRTWANYFQNLCLEEYLIIHPGSAEAELLETILPLFEDDKFDQPQVCITSDLQTHFNYRCRYHSGKIPLHGMRVRDGYVSMGNNAYKFVYCYQDGVANGPYRYYSSCEMCYGQCRDGRKYGKTYSYRNYSFPGLPWGGLNGITDHDLNYEVNDLNSVINIHLYGNDVVINDGDNSNNNDGDNSTVIASQRRDYILGKHDTNFRCLQDDYNNYTKASSSNNSNYSQQSSWSISCQCDSENKITRVDILKHGIVVASFDFDHQNFCLLGPPQPLTWLDRLYYSVKWLCPVFFPDY